MRRLLALPLLLLAAALLAREPDDGRRVYADQACWQCHRHATEPFPALTDARRAGPVIGEPWLARSREWHRAHLYAPRTVVAESVMPAYQHLFTSHPKAQAVQEFVERYDTEGGEHEDGIVTQSEYEAGGGKDWDRDRGLLDTGNGVVSLADAAPRPTPELGALVAWLEQAERRAPPWVRAPAPAPPRKEKAESVRRGRALFARECAGCHGERADGNGTAARFFGDHPPRNFLRGEYKFRSTLDPAPLDEDLYRTIRRGAGPSMPAWPLLSDRQVWDLVEYLKSLHYGYLTQELFVTRGGETVLAFVQGEEAEVDHAAGAALDHGDLVIRKGPDARWWLHEGAAKRPIEDGLKVDDLVFRLGEPVYDWMEDFRPRPAEIPEPPFPYSDASAEIGAKVYREFGCANCHGDAGRGDGPVATQQRGSLGQLVPPTDYTLGARFFKGGADARSLVRSFLTGLHGTPMPAYGANFQVARSAPPDAAPWHLAHFVQRQAGLPGD